MRSFRAYWVIVSRATTGLNAKVGINSSEVRVSNPSEARAGKGASRVSATPARWSVFIEQALRVELVLGEGMLIGEETVVGPL